MPFTGELIAICTVLCWTVSVQLFESASKKVGATPVNIIRLTTALALFSIMMMIRHGTILPLHFPAHAWFYLGLSGVVGFLWGYFLIQSPCRDRSPCSHADLQFISPDSSPAGMDLPWSILYNIPMERYVHYLVRCQHRDFRTESIQNETIGTQPAENFSKRHFACLWGNDRTGCWIHFKQNRYANG